MTLQMMDWAEKYRPKRPEQIAGNPDVVKAVKRFIKNQNYPRLLLVGESGTGKTTTALILVNNTFENPDYQEFNASSDRGIDIVRYDIAPFAESRSPLGLPFRTIILEEVENFTYDAQMALRRVMEMHAHTCKFILTCNDSYPLIWALRSRCRPLEFRPISKIEMVSVLKRICIKEQIHNYRTKQLYDIAKESHGDLRFAVETLQIVAENRDEIDQDILDGISTKKSNKYLESMIQYALEGKLEKALVAFDESSTFISSKSLFDFIRQELIFSRDYNQEDKARIALAISNVRSNSYEKNEILGFIAKLYYSSHKPKRRG